MYQTLPLPPQPETTITTTAVSMRNRIADQIRAALDACPGEPKVTLQGDLRDWLEIIDALEGRPSCPHCNVIRSAIHHDYQRGLKDAWYAVNSKIVLGKIAFEQDDWRTGMVMACNAITEVPGFDWHAGSIDKR